MVKKFRDDLILILLLNLKLAFQSVFACADNKIGKSITNTLTVVKGERNKIENQE